MSQAIDDDGGKAIVEFAFIAPVFLGMTLSIFEFSGIMFVQTLLEGGAREASRYGITGQQPEGVSRDDMILQIVGDNSFGIIDMDELVMTTKVYDSFNEVGQPEPFTDENSNGSYDLGEPYTDSNGNGTWDPDMGAVGLGGPGEVVVYTMIYDWPIMIPVFEPFFGDHVTLEANIAVRNEPFD
ncbi:MAG: TadE/TadG family type IV pilus assembly protein [Pseudomonadota bacterium]